MAIAVLLGSGMVWGWFRFQKVRTVGTGIVVNIKQSAFVKLFHPSRPSPIPTVTPQMPIPQFQLEQTFTGAGNSIHSLAITPDSQTLITGTDYAKALLWDLSRQCVAEGCAIPERILSIYSWSIYNLVISQDSEMVVAGSWEYIRIWELKTGILRRSIKAHFGSIYVVVLGHKHNLLATGSSDQSVKVWDLATGKLKQTMTGHDARVQALAINHDDKYLASGDVNGKIKVWSLEQACPETGCRDALVNLDRHTMQITSLAITPDDRFLISTSADRSIKIWELTTGKLLQDITAAHEGSVLAIAISPDGKFFATGSADKKIKLWEVSTGVLLDTISRHTDSVQSLIFSPDGKLLVSGGNDRLVHVWRRTF